MRPYPARLRTKFARTASKMLRQNTSSEFCPHSTTSHPARDVRKRELRGQYAATVRANASTLSSRAGGSIVFSNHASGRKIYEGIQLTASCRLQDAEITAATATK